ncbi:hypothetical protein GGR58DRAFT_454803 [Xylaria digitata]|nr:hypothetical protein GGR58DRAFT_454803 [Xylaria digitata]
MQQYSQNSGLANEIDGHTNILFLRKNLRFLFDEKRFVIVPRIDQSAPASAIHIASPDAYSELQILYQNRPLQPVSVGDQDVAPEFLSTGLWGLVFAIATTVSNAPSY